MPNEHTGPGIPAWKKAAGVSQRADSAQPAWRKGPAQPDNVKGRWARRTKLSLAALGFIIASIGLVVVVLLFLPGKVAYVVLVGEDYADNLTIPHNAYGWNGLQGLKELDGEGPTPTFLSRFFPQSMRFKSEPVPYPGKPLNEVIGASFKNSKEKTVIVFLALHGGGSPDQGAYLFLDDRNGQRRVPVKDLILQLNHEDLKDKYKLLILDATQVTSSWPLGMLHNDFAHELAKLEDDIKGVPHLCVLSASGPDQRSWVSEQWGQSAFAHFVIEGLRGQGEANDGNRVHALSLYNFVRKQVSDWASKSRGKLQEPVLLPKPDTAENKSRAAEIKLAVVDSNARAEKPQEEGASPPPPSKLPEDVARPAWQACAELQKQTPTPAVYNPDHWRLYIDTLVRYEELLRAQARPERIDAVRGRLETLHRELKQARVPPLNSLVNALPFPVALGLAPAGTERQLTFDVFKGKTLQPELWKKLQDQAEADGDSDAHMLRMRYGGALLTQVRDDASFETACARADALFPAGMPKPAEVRYLSDLNRIHAFLRPQAAKLAASPELLQLALEVRRLAEAVALAATDLPPGVYASADRVSPWIRKKVEDADRERRLGEDLFFASEQALLDKSQGHFKDARRLYLDAAADGDAVRLALQARDQAFASLPYYARWLAAQPPADVKRPEDFHIQIGMTDIDLKAAWRNAHDLAARLALTPDPKWIAEPAPELVRSGTRLTLRQEATALQKELDALQREFERQSRDLLNKGKSQSVWHEVEHALLVPTPFMSPDLRTELVKKSRILSGYVEKSDQAATANPAEAKLAALRQGHMLLEMLGERRLDTKKRDAGFVGFDQLNDRLLHVGPDTWQKDLANVSEQLARHWQELPADADKAAASAHRQTDPVQGLRLFEDAEGLCRQLDGAAAQRLTSPVMADSRRLHFADLLMWESERTYFDHWHDYYAKAGDMYLADARELLKGVEQKDSDSKLVPAWEGVLKSKEARLRQPAGVHLQADPPRIAVTSERDFEARQKLEVDPAAPPAICVFVTPDDKPEFLRIKGSLQAGGDIICPVGLGSPNTDTLRFRMGSPYVTTAEQSGADAAPHRESLAVRGVYRGQTLTGTNTIDLLPAANVTMHKYPEPDVSTIAVRTDKKATDANDSAIVIILDCSGSMDNKKTPTRFQQACDALEEVLRKSIKANTRVSLWVFGQLEEDIGKELPKPTGNYRAESESRIRPLFPPEIWQPANPAQVNAWMKEVRSLKPWGFTPLVRSMLKARKDLEGVVGHKTMLVLTDGMDTLFEPQSVIVNDGGKDGGKDMEHDRTKGDWEYNPDGKLSIRDCLNQKFKNSDIDIQMICFQQEQEADRSRAQFEQAINEDLGGKYYKSVDELDALIRNLRDALRQRLFFRLVEDNGKPVHRKDSAEDQIEAYDVSDLGSAPVWFRRPDGIRPEFYDVIVNPRKLKRVQLGRADRLLLTLTRSGYERMVYADEPEFKDRPHKDVGEWRLALLQNQRSPSRGLADWLVTVEDFTNTRVPDAGILKQIKPRFVWLEAKSAKGDVRPQGRHWGNCTGYPAPAFRMMAPNWPDDAAAVLHAWIGDVPVAFSSPARDKDRLLETDFHVTTQHKGSAVAVEEVRLEKRWVEDEPGVRREKDCLVVRVSYTSEPRDAAAANDRRVFVRLIGPSLQGEEHRFYDDVNKYAGIFWPVPEDRWKTEPFRLDLISVGDFKGSAQAAELQAREPPNVNGLAPNPVRLNAAQPGDR